MFARESAFNRANDEMEDMLTRLRTEREKLGKTNAQLENIDKRISNSRALLEDVHSRMIALIVYLQGNSQIPPYVLEELEEIDREIYAELR